MGNQSAECGEWEILTCFANRGGARGVPNVQVPSEHRGDAALVHDDLNRELGETGYGFVCLVVRRHWEIGRAHV